MAKYRYFTRLLGVPDALASKDQPASLPPGQRVVAVIDARRHQLPTHTNLLVLVEETVD